MRRETEANGKDQNVQEARIDWDEQSRKKYSSQFSFKNVISVNLFGSLKLFLPFFMNFEIEEIQLINKFAGSIHPGAFYDSQVIFLMT